MNQERRSFRRGFTLTELLLAASLLALVGAAVLATFANGTKVWQKITGRLSSERVDLFLDKFSADVRNTFLLSSIPLEGDEEDVRFPIVTVPTKTSQGPGRVEYVFDRYDRTIVREESSYSGVYRRRIESSRAMVRNVNMARFSYFYYDPVINDYGWISRWPDDSLSYDQNKKVVLPVAVRVEMDVMDRWFVQHVTKTIFIPAGCCRTIEKK